MRPLERPRVRVRIRRCRQNLRSVVPVIVCSVPNVKPSVVDNKEFVFPGVAASECPDGPRDHRSSFYRHSSTFIGACMATGVLASTSFRQVYVEFTVT